MPTWAIKDYMDAAGRECSLTPPDDWLASTATADLQFVQLLKDVTRELLRRHAWAGVTTDTTFTGAGSVFSLPTDYFRVLDDEEAVYETSPIRRAVKPMPDRGTWTKTTAWNWTAYQRYYRMTGSNIEFLAAIPTGGTVVMDYVKNTWCTKSDGTTPYTVYTNKADLSLIPGDLLQLGMIWRWRRAKGLVYADRRAEFESELARAVGDDTPRRKIDFTYQRSLVSNPMVVPVPDYIPPS
jgi:hypothetical protein